MANSNRRTTLKHFGMAALAAATLAGASLPAAAADDLVVSRAYENHKRGTIHSLDPSTRGLVVIWDDLGRVKLKASDLVVKATTGSGPAGNSYAELKEGQIVDIHWYDYVDFLVAKSSPATSARAKEMVAQGARAEGIPGTEHEIRAFEMGGMITKLDPATYTMSVVNPGSGEVVQLPQIRSAAGQEAFKTLKVGDNVTCVYSIQTALNIHIIR
jgi:hypothetical protein